MAILKKKSTAATKVLSIRVPELLHSDIESVRATAEAFGYELDVSAIVIDALSKAVRSAREQLTALGEAQSATRSAAVEGPIAT